MRWVIRSQLADRVRPAWFGLRDVTVRPASESLAAEVLNRGGELMARYMDPAAALPAFAPARRMYHACGLDPSKVRPSSEALVRRILQGKGLYRVNTAVDAANLASITFLRPVGLYDSDLIEPLDAGEGANQNDRAVSVVILRSGTPSESYAGIGKDRIHLEGRPTLVDQSGPFGNPSADSDRTRVTTATRRLLFVVFEPADESDETARSHVSTAASIMQRHLGGTIEE